MSSTDSFYSSIIKSCKASHFLKMKACMLYAIMLPLFPENSTVHEKNYIKNDPKDKLKYKQKVEIQLETLYINLAQKATEVYTQKKSTKDLLATQLNPYLSSAKAQGTCVEPPHSTPSNPRHTSQQLHSSRTLSSSYVHETYI